MPRPFGRPIEVSNPDNARLPRKARKSKKAVEAESVCLMGGTDELPASDYSAFIKRKSQLGKLNGFKPLWMPDFLKGFQSFLVDNSIRKGRSAIVLTTRSRALEQKSNPQAAPPLLK